MTNTQHPIESLTENFTDLLTSGHAIKGDSFVLAVGALYELAELELLVNNAMRLLSPSVTDEHPCLMMGIGRLVDSISRKLTGGLAVLDAQEARTMARHMLARSTGTANELIRRNAAGV